MITAKKNHILCLPAEKNSNSFRQIAATSTTNKLIAISCQTEGNCRVRSAFYSMNKGPNELAQLEVEESLGVYESAEESIGVDSDVARGFSASGAPTPSSVSLASPKTTSRRNTRSVEFDPEDQSTSSRIAAATGPLPAREASKTDEQAATSTVPSSAAAAHGSAGTSRTAAAPSSTQPSSAEPAQRHQVQQQHTHTPGPQPGGASPTNSKASTSAPTASGSGAQLNGTAGSSSRSTASTMFSVPLSKTPATGIFDIPEEAFRIKDLDTGREYALDKRYWIKDMDTGTVYVLDQEGGGAGGGAGGTPRKITELLSGRELSVGQFEEALGYFREPHLAAAAGEVWQGADGGGGAASAPQQLAQKGLRSLNAGASWVKHNVSSAIQKVRPNSPRGGGAGELAAGGAALGAGPSTSGREERGNVPVKVSRKSFREFSDLRVVQQLSGHQGVVWTMKFSRNGRYLATAGQDCTIQVWEVLPGRAGGSRQASPTVQKLRSQEEEAAAVAAAAATGTSGGGGDGDSSNGRVFSSQPYRVYSGHKQDVLDLCWSKTQFLLSASMDKTVRLWHITMDECLRVFKHSDFVTAIDFHPSDDKVFLSGSIDGKVRLWNIPEQRVASWQDVHEMVTAVSYAPGGRKAVVGTMKGKCRFYSVQNASLEYEAQLDVKNKRGQHARGKKITGLQFLPSEPGKLLITSNDSRIRLYDGYTLRCKYKGHTNRNTQIRASLSPGGDFITCGSDDGWVYVWATQKSSLPGGSSPPPSSDENPFHKEKSTSYECFQANGDIVTCAIFAPESAQRSLDVVPPSAQAGLQPQESGVARGDKAGGEVALDAARARGQVLLTAGYSGEIKVYENLGLPQWL